MFLLDSKKINLISGVSFTTVANAKRITKLSYVGNVSHSAKLKKTETSQGELTYGIYLAPADSSGYNVCEGASKWCKAACLNMSGHNKIDTRGVIQNARVKKTQLIINYPAFMLDWITAEIKRYHKSALDRNFTFSVRINCTSDLDITKYKNSRGLNLLEQFPDIQFYDYTKIFSRLDQGMVYSNYDFTYSFNGVNYNKCLEALKRNVRVAMVFEKTLPLSYDGFKVVNGDKYDARYLDPDNAIVGLVFKRVRNKINLKETPFVISLEDKLRNI